jgi:hypothetical protein
MGTNGGLQPASETYEGGGDRGREAIPNLAVKEGTTLFKGWTLSIAWVWSSAILLWSGSPVRIDLPKLVTETLLLAHSISWRAASECLS